MEGERRTRSGASVEGMLKFYILVGLVVAGAATSLIAFVGGPAWWLLWGIIVLLLVVALFDILQRRHAILRNYPVIGRARYLLESIRPEMQQYFIERNFDGRPFDRDTRSLVYERAKGVSATKAFGTERDVTRPGYEYILHSLKPAPMMTEPPRVRLGGPDCKQPYDISIFNISSMSFGALSKQAVLAMGHGAAKGGFAHETGEGGLTKYHLETGADLVWEFGSGYFGCRAADGRFDPDLFAEKSAHPHVKAVLVKLSQGAKPGLGGVVPAEKMTPEIAEARGVPVGEACISPPAHSAFTTPRELMVFIGRLRELSGGKPIGFKLCVGSRHQVLSICKAMLETGILPDFITVDGAEGGTGAAPLEYEDHVGAPLTEGLLVLHNALVGTGLRGRIKVGASGKIALASDIVRRIAIGADFTNSARAMMMAVGCIQAQKCHTNECPVGVATQDRRRSRALHVPDKAERVYRYQKETVRQAMSMVATMGLTSFDQIEPSMVMRRISHTHSESCAVLFDWLEPGELVTGTQHGGWAQDWARATADSFEPVLPEIMARKRS